MQRRSSCPWSFAAVLIVAWVVSGCSPEKASSHGSGHGDEPDASAPAQGGRTGGGRGGSGGSSSGNGGSVGSGGSGGSSSMADAGSSADSGRGADAAAGGRGGSPDGGAGRDGGAAPGDGGPSAAAPTQYRLLCAMCHGPEGQGVAMMGPEIQHPVRDFATWVVRNGRTHPMFKEPMPKFTAEMLPNAQLNQILDYLSAFPKPTTGAGLYKDFCGNCHGADAKGGVTMRNITLATLNQAMFITNVRGGHHAGEFSNRREFMPKWTAAQLSDAEIRLIYMYVAAGAGM